MNMLTGDSGMANSQVFYSQNVDKIGLEPTKAIFPRGETGRTSGEWKSVNRPYSLFGFKFDNWAMKWVETKPKFNKPVSNGEGVVMKPASTGGAVVGLSSGMGIVNVVEGMQEAQTIFKARVRQ